MTVRPKAKPYNSATDHTDRGDYEIYVSEAHGIEGILTDGSPRKYWSASLIYTTKTRKIVQVTDSFSLGFRTKIWCVFDDEEKNRKARQKAHDRLLPVLELYREYRRHTRKRYEVLRDKDPKLPVVPKLPDQHG